MPSRYRTSRPSASRLRRIRRISPLRRFSNVRRSFTLLTDLIIGARQLAANRSPEAIWPQQSVEPGCGFVEAFQHVDLAVLADKRDGEPVAVRLKADAPGQDGVRRRIQRGELLLDAGFDIDRDQPLTMFAIRRRRPRSGIDSLT